MSARTRWRLPVRSGKDWHPARSGARGRCGCLRISVSFGATSPISACCGGTPRRDSPCGGWGVSVLLASEKSDRRGNAQRALHLCKYFLVPHPLEHAWNSNTLRTALWLEIPRYLLKNVRTALAGTISKAESDFVQCNFLIFHTNLSQTVRNGMPMSATMAWRHPVMWERVVIRSSRSIYARPNWYGP